MQWGKQYSLINNFLKPLKHSVSSVLLSDSQNPVNYRRHYWPLPIVNGFKNPIIRSNSDKRFALQKVSQVGVREHSDA